MKRVLLVAVLAGIFSLAYGAAPALAVPGGPDGNESSSQQPQQDEGDCAGGVLVVEQLCDVAEEAAVPERRLT